MKKPISDFSIIHIVFGIVMLIQGMFFLIGSFPTYPFFTVIAMIDFFCCLFHFKYVRKIKNDYSEQDKQVINAEKESVSNSIMNISNSGKTVEVDPGSSENDIHLDFKHDNKTTDEIPISINVDLLSEEKAEILASNDVKTDIANKVNDLKDPEPKKRIINKTISKNS